jgi:hypothetical protein
MSSSNVIQLAPTLSAEEKFKMIVTDFHRELMGEKPVFSEAERQAIIHCENRPAWEEYTRHIGIMQWADTFWIKDIETEKLRVLASSLILGRAVDRLVMDAFMPMPEKMLDRRCADVREDVLMFEKNSMEFYAYPGAITQIEQELYGMPLFNEKKKKTIASYYEAADEMFENYNKRILMLSESNGAKKSLRPMAENLEGLIAKKPIPSKELIDGLVKEIMDIVDSEMDMLGR